MKKSLFASFATIAIAGCLIGRLSATGSTSNLVLAVAGAVLLSLAAAALIAHLLRRQLGADLHQLRAMANRLAAGDVWASDDDTTSGAGGCPRYINCGGTLSALADSVPPPWPSPSGREDDD